MSIDEIKKEFEEKFVFSYLENSADEVGYIWKSIDTPIKVWAFIEQTISAIGADSFELGAKACREYYDHQLAKQKAEFDLKEDYYQVHLQNARIDREKVIDDCIAIINMVSFNPVLSQEELWANSLFEKITQQLQLLKEK
jgi:hypothetical protein